MLRNNRLQTSTFVSFKSSVSTMYFNICQWSVCLYWVRDYILLSVGLLGLCYLFFKAYLTLCLLVPSAFKPLQTVWTQIRPDKMSGLIWILTVWHSDGIPKNFFPKRWFWKKSADNKKHVKLSRRQSFVWFDSLCPINNLSSEGKELKQFKFWLSIIV